MSKLLSWLSSRPLNLKARVFLSVAGVALLLGVLWSWDALHRAALWRQAQAAVARQDYTTAQALLRQWAELAPHDPRSQQSARQVLAEFRARVEAGAPPITLAPPAARVWLYNGQPRQTHEAPRPGEVRVIGIKELGNFDYDPEKGGGVPPDVAQLNGLKVRMTGYLLPLSQSDQITDFALVPSLFSCCFGQPPGVQHAIMVHCTRAVPGALVNGLVEAEGVLRVEEVREEGYTQGLFELRAASAHAAGP